MNAKPYRLAAALVFLCLAVPGFAQTSPENSSKGNAADGSRPADGAIKGGSIVPGESGGMPDDRAKSRCSDLTGTLREQCLAQEEGRSSAGSSGNTRLPEVDVAKPPPTREAPPPQNPR
jgi:hypothetical protein